LAADQVYVDAQFRLGVMFDQGESVVQNHQEAVKYYRLAAALMHANAQASLGMMYGQGQGIPKDDVRAHMWLDLAASRGNSLAEHGRNLLAKKMSPSQITEAQGMADDCEKNNYQDCN